MEIGSGPWTCESTGPTLNDPGAPPAGTVGGGCSFDGTMAPGPGLGTYTLTRTGCNIASGACNAPGNSASAACGTATCGPDYFHSSGALAKYIWTGDDGSGSHDLSILLTVNSCKTATPSANCPHWQQGIGNPGGTGTNAVGVAQRSLVNAFKGVSWIAYSTETDTGTRLVIACGPGYLIPGTTLSCPASGASGNWVNSAVGMPGIGAYPAPLWEEGAIISGIPVSDLYPATPVGGPNGSYTNCAAPVGTGSAYPQTTNTQGGYDC